MTDFYGIGPRNKRLGYRKSEHICYYCQLDKHQDCEGRKSVTRDKAKMRLFMLQERKH